MNISFIRTYAYPFLYLLFLRTPFFFLNILYYIRLSLCQTFLSFNLFLLTYASLSVLSWPYFSLTCPFLLVRFRVPNCLSWPFQSFPFLSFPGKKSGSQVFQLHDKEHKEQVLGSVEIPYVHSLYNRSHTVRPHIFIRCTYAHAMPFSTVSNVYRCYGVTCWRKLE